MYQRDFILRMIEMLGELIAGILGLIKKGNFQKASQSIENAYQELLKQDASYFNKIPYNDLTDTLIREHNFTNGHLEILSELFYAQAELSYAQGNYNESLEFYQKSLILLKFIIKELKIFSFEKQSKIDHLQNRIDELENMSSS
ncbi:MAG: hypothetical protein JXJ22_17200 [Bacteroidales bacterium]|nr:hypothetical protein [Bacteroidales bacterium]